VLKRRQDQEPRGRGGQRPQREEREDGCVLLLGRSQQGRAEAVDTLTMISHGVEISIAGGGADEKDELGRGAASHICTEQFINLEINVLSDLTCWGVLCAVFVGLACEATTIPQCTPVMQPTMPS